MIKIILFVIIIIPQISFSAENIEKDLKEITNKLRCMTCQNQTIYDSDAEFSQDIKKIVRKKLLEGKNEQEIIDFIEKRYGEYILFEPKFDKKNIVLWGFPFIVLITSFLILATKIKFLLKT